MAKAVVRTALAILTIFAALLVAVPEANADPGLVNIDLDRPQLRAPNVRSLSLFSIAPIGPVLEHDDYIDNLSREDPNVEEKVIAIAGELMPNPVACLDFEDTASWHGTSPWTQQFAGWGLQAEEDGGYYDTRNIEFAKETLYRGGTTATKISSDKPYSGLLGSPMIDVDPGTKVTVTVAYSLYEHNSPLINANGHYPDWASMVVKPDAAAAGAGTPVNGFGYGKWRELSQTVTAGPSGKIMVLLMGNSSAEVNESAVYFDNVTIQIGDQYLTDCRYEETISF